MSSKKSLTFKMKFLRANRDIFNPDQREKLYWFFREQFRFGHREILLDYISEDYDNLIQGFLQHGFHGKALAPWQTLPRTFSEDYPVFVWNQATESSAKSLGQTHVHAIGAPWLYLLKQKEIDFDGKGVLTRVQHTKARDILVVPNHGSGHFLPGENYQQLPRAYRNLLGDADASVLLYYTEFCDPAIRKSWSDAGFDIYSSGMAWGPEHRTLWTYNGGRVNYLANTLTTLLNHRNVICQAPTTLALYAISLGIPTKINTTEEMPSAMKIVSQGKGVERLKKIELELDKWAEDTLGTSFHELSITDEKRSLVMTALGASALKTPQKLREILPLLPGVIPLYENI
jgi:hypothetical protein